MKCEFLRGFKCDADGEIGDEIWCAGDAVVRVGGEPCCVECLEKMRACDDPEAYPESPL